QLASERKVIPTASELSRRARCSLRLIFERFTSLDELGLAVFDHVLRLHALHLPPYMLGADRKTRIEFEVSRRAASCERWLPLWRAALGFYETSADIATRISRVRKLTRVELRLIYRPELSGLPGSKGRLVLNTLEALMDFESWARMREYDGLSFE